MTSQSDRPERDTGTSRFTATVYHSIADIPVSGLDHLVPDEAESWDYYQAIEQIPPPGFELGAIAVHDGPRVCALAPIFRTRYRLDTPLQGSLRRLTDWINLRRPGLTSLSVLGLGSPMSDNLTIGFHGDLSAAERITAFDAMLRALRAEAASGGQQLIAIKSIDSLAGEMTPTFAEHDFNCVTSVPLAMLDLPYPSLDSYLASLKPKTASYFRRKYRSAAALRIEYVDDITPHAPALNELFHATLAQSKVSYGDFQELDPAYFTRVKAALGPRAQFMLCWHQDALVSFQTFLHGEDRAVAKQIGMRYPAARELNLYFINWLEMIRYAIEHRIPRIEMGATTYSTKLLFGGYLERRHLYYRFRRDISNRLLKPLAPLFDFENNDPELKALDETQRQKIRA